MSKPKYIIKKERWVSGAYINDPKYSHSLWIHREDRKMDVFIGYGSLTHCENKLLKLIAKECTENE